MIIEPTNRIENILNDEPGIFEIADRISSRPHLHSEHLEKEATKIVEQYGLKK